jgi:hypothetical protein
LIFRVSFKANMAKDSRVTEEFCTAWIRRHSNINIIWNWILYLWYEDKKNKFPTALANLDLENGWIVWLFQPLSAHTKDTNQHPWKHDIASAIASLLCINKTRIKKNKNHPFCHWFC